MGAACQEKGRQLGTAWFALMGPTGTTGSERRPLSPVREGLDSDQLTGLWKFTKML